MVIASVGLGTPPAGPPAPPAVLAPAVLAPAVLAPAVLAPVVAAPAVLAPVVAAPVVVAPVVAAPGVVAPVVVAPVVVAPVVVAPVVVAAAEPDPDTPKRAGGPLGRRFSFAPSLAQVTDPVTRGYPGQPGSHAGVTPLGWNGSVAGTQPARMPNPDRQGEHSCKLAS